MDFSFNEEQVMIRDTAAAFLADVSDSAQLRRVMGGDAAALAGAWQRIVTEMGWQALPVPEAHGGLGLGQLELAIVLEQAGARLLSAPLYATVACAGNAIQACAGEDQAAAWLPAIAAGETTWALAVQGPATPWGPAMADVRYCREAGGYRLEGQAAYVVDGADAERLLVAARPGDAAGAEARLFRVEGGATGLSRRRTPSMDQTRRLGALSLEGVLVEEDALLAGGQGSLAQALDLATVALAAELLGTAQQVLELAVAYTLERKQFGRPVAGFQAIKHKAADMMLRNECARSALYYAACIADGWLAGRNTSEELSEAASIAKASCGDAAFRNAGEALQMHGGNGFTWEYDVHLYFKRARASRALFGASEWHRERLATQLLGPLDQQEVAA